MRKHFWTTAALVLAAQPLSAASWTYESVSVALGEDAGGEYADLVVKGGSNSGCVPNEAAGEIDHAEKTAVFSLKTPGPDTACFSAFRDWQYALRLPLEPASGDFDPAGSWDIELRVGEEKIAQFEIVIPDAARTVAIKATGDSAMAPSQGMWWSSDQPGTGMAFNMDTEGRWFAALYLYDEVGAPTFATLQGQSLAYDLDAAPLEPYAVGTSPIIFSEGGQCLGCPWTAATAEATEDEAQILFWDRNRAKLTVGDWSLDLHLLPETAASSQRRAAPILDRHYVLTLEGEAGQHVAVVKGVPGSGSVATGQERVALECVDCRTVDTDGAASDTADKALQESVERLNFLGTGGTQWSVASGDLDGRPLVDKTGGIITAALADPDDAQAETIRIELRLLPDGWRE